MRPHGAATESGARSVRRGREDFRADLVSLAHDSKQAIDGSRESDWQYRVVTAARTA